MEKALGQFIFAVILSATVANRSYKTRSLVLSGAVAGFLIMIIHLYSGYRFGIMLPAFFCIEGERRNWMQVLSNTGIGAVLSVAIASQAGWQNAGLCLDSKESVLITSLIGGIIGHLVGVLSHHMPWLMHVPGDTNGDLKKAGLVEALTAGTLIGCTFVYVGFFTTRCSVKQQLLVIHISAVTGLLGSLIGSRLGATLQYKVEKISGLNFVDNNDVDLVSVLMTTLLTSVACVCTFSESLIPSKQFRQS